MSYIIKFCEFNRNSMIIEGRKYNYGQYYKQNVLYTRDLLESIEILMNNDWRNLNDTQKSKVKMMFDFAGVDKHRRFNVFIVVEKKHRIVWNGYFY